MSALAPATRWRPDVSSEESIARLVLLSGSHVAATRVLHDALFECGGDVYGLPREWTGRAVLVVPVQVGRRYVGIMALADLSGRVFSDREFAVAQRVSQTATHAVLRGRTTRAARGLVERFLAQVGGETAALYALGEDGTHLRLLAASPCDGTTIRVS